VDVFDIIVLGFCQAAAIRLQVSHIQFPVCRAGR